MTPSVPADRARLRRILCFTALAGAVVAGALLLLRPTSPPTPDDGAPPPSASWLRLPDTPLDLRDPSTREALLRVVDWEVSAAGAPSWPDTLAGRCGRDHSTPERYLAIVDNAFLTPPGPSWRVEVAPIGSMIDVRVREHPFPSRKSGKKEQPRYRRWPAEKLRELREAWSAPALWTKPAESESACTHDRIIVLQACVRGVYRMNFPKCNHRSPEAARLWEALQDVIPPHSL